MVYDGLGSYWPTDVEASIIVGLSGYLAATGYSINTNVGGSIDLRVGYLDELTALDRRTIIVQIDPSSSITEPMQIGLSGWQFNLECEIGVFTKTDKDTDILLYQITRFLRDSVPYYNWSISTTGGLATGYAGNQIYFDGILATRDRKNFKSDETITNELLRHRGFARFSAEFISENLN